MLEGRGRDTGSAIGGPGQAHDPLALKTPWATLRFTALVHFYCALFTTGVLVRRRRTHVNDAVF